MKRINVRLAVMTFGRACSCSTKLMQASLCSRLTATLMAAIMMTMMSFANRWSSENRAMLASAMSSRDRGRAVLKTQDWVDE